MRRLSAVLLTTTLALAACGNETKDAGSPPAVASATASAAAPSPTGPAAKDELVAAIKKTSAVPSSMTLKTETTGVTINASGAGDPASKSYAFHMTMASPSGSVDMDYVILGTELYLKSALFGDTKVWFRIDTTKVKSLDKLGLGDLTDPSGFGNAEQTIVSVERTAPGTFKGVIDATKRTGQAGEAAKQLGEAAKAVAFEATVDAQGYVTTLRSTTPAAGQVPATDTTVTQADFGKPVAVTKPPAAQTKDMPAEFYTRMQ